MQFYSDFHRAIDVAQNDDRLDLQKKVTAIGKLFAPAKTKKGGSAHTIYLGKVEYNRSSSTEVLQPTPQLQIPSLTTKADVGSHSSIMVAIPRKLAQLRGYTVGQLGSAFATPMMAAKSRRVENQVDELLSATYRTNPIMDGISDEGSNTTDVFPTGNNRLGIYASGAKGKLHFLDFMDIRRILANERGDSLTMAEYAKMGSAKTLDDTRSIIYCDNDSWFAFVAQNRNFFFNKDFTSYSASFENDGFKVHTLQDSAVITTSKKLLLSDGFQLSDTTQVDGTGKVGPGTALGAIAGADWRPIYVLARGAFELMKPSADDYGLSVKALENRSYERAVYGECNLFGKRIYTEQVYRFWINVNDRGAIA